MTGVQTCALPICSLGQGISAACGMALAAKSQGNPCRVYALLGDGEIQDERWGITALQIFIHLDEGHYGTPEDNSTWKPNCHAHIVWDWILFPIDFCFCHSPKILEPAKNQNSDKDIISRAGLWRGGHGAGRRLRLGRGLPLQPGAAALAACLGGAF